MRYYQLWSTLEGGAAILRPGANLKPPFTNWVDPRPWGVPVPEPLMLEIKEGRQLLPYYSNPFPIMKSSLLSKIRSAGVDNIDDYEVVIVSPENGQRTEGYRALKIVGAVSAIDEDKSEGVMIDESGLAGRFFDRVIIDESKANGALLFRLADNLSYVVVEEKIKDSLLSMPGTESLRFEALFEVDEGEYEEDPDLA